MSDRPDVARIADSVYRVVLNERSETVYVAGSAADRWIFWNGRVFNLRPNEDQRTRPGRSGADVHQSLSAPMPATVLKVLATPGAAVRKGDTLMILEAMKMELPIRAMADAVVREVCCREGELVQAGATLVELD